jgi:NAD(P)H-nitrite reductase large subunit
MKIKARLSERMHLVIIGNGITGTTVARLVRKKKDWDITIISSESKHFYSRTALMYIYMGHMKYEHTKPYEDHFWEKNRIFLMQDHVESIDFNARMLNLRSGEFVQYDKLVIATGSKPNMFGWPGQDLNGVQGLYSLQDLEKMEKYSAGAKRAVVVGGGLIGVEAAEMLHSRHIPVTFLVREKNYWDNVLPEEEACLINREIRSNGIDLRLKTELREILGDEQGKVRAVVTGSGEEIECDLVMLTAGVRPNIGFLEESELNTNRGVLVDHYFKTNIEHVFAAGDCAQFTDAAPGDPAVEALWYTGKLQATALARLLCGGEHPYDRSVWFNSAKFFDIEYQTYGRVPNVLPDNQQTFYWEHESGRKCMRINSDKQSGAVVGCNVFGIRIRQVVFEKWIMEKRGLEYVLEHLGEALFDSEFEYNPHPHILKQYNEQAAAGNALKIRSKRGLRHLFQFRRTKA